jgi:dolichol-phosphate mannosyltransferase
MKVIELSKNFGQINAVLCGLSNSDAECSVVVSADMQDDLGLVERMLEQFYAKNEIVICHRESRQDRITSQITSKIAYSFIRREIRHTPVGGFDYYLLGANSRRALLSLRGRFSFLQADILRLGFSTSFIPYARQNRREGKSSYSTKMRLELFMNALLDISFNSIRAMARIGALISSSGFLFSLYVFIGYLKGTIPFQGFTAILCSILVIGGFVILMLGVIGEYIWRIYDIARNRPQYIVSNIEKL